MRERNTQKSPRHDTKKVKILCFAVRRGRARGEKEVEKGVEKLKRNMKIKEIQTSNRLSLRDNAHESRIQRDNTRTLCAVAVSIAPKSERESILSGNKEYS